MRNFSHEFFLSYVFFFFFFFPQQSSERDTFTLNNQLQEELTSIELPMIYTQPGSRQNAASPPLKESLQRVLDFFITLAVCNTVIVAKYPHRDEVCTFILVCKSLKLFWC